jgi:DEAD/DEAH box helicase domain-containing protein
MKKQNMSKIAERVVLDLETKRSFAEVEGRKLELLGVSVVGIYSYKDDQFKIFLEKDIALLLPYLQRAELVVGFNIKGFDFPVLQPYFDFNLTQLKMLDIFEEVQKNLGFRLSLNNIAQATLEIGKIGTGLDALKYFRFGQMDKLAEYCQHDVFITRELYEYGKRHGHLLYFRGHRLETIPVNWAECRSIDEILKEAFANRQTLEIEYASTADRLNSRQKRQIDIYDFELGRVIAHCHLRQELRTFNIRRILKAKFIDKKYEIPADFNKEKHP